MKYGLLVCLVGAMFLLAPATQAQTNLNLMGLSADPVTIEQCIIGPGMQIYTAHLFISRPENPDFNGGEVRDVAWVNGFECRVWIEGDAMILAWHYPVNAINAGINGNTVVGFAEPVPVIDNLAVVATLEIFMTYPTGEASGDSGDEKLSPMPCDNPTALVYMAPTRPTASVVGMTAYLDAEDPDNPLVGTTNYGSLQDDLIMLLEAQPVASEPHSWGGVKALYR